MTGTNRCDTCGHDIADDAGGFCDWCAWKLDDERWLEWWQGDAS